MSEKSDSC